MVKKGAVIVLVGYSKSGEMTLPMSFVLSAQIVLFVYLFNSFLIFCHFSRFLVLFFKQKTLHLTNKIIAHMGYNCKQFLHKNKPFT